MAKLIKRKKKRIEKVSHSYFAVKSQNEIYYQMASIFKHASAGEASLANKIVHKSLVGKSYEIFLDNSV